MRFFASAAALPSAAATGLARDAKRGCCGAKRPLATATSSAQLILNMILLFCLSKVQLGRTASCCHQMMPGGPQLTGSPPRGRYESVVTVHEAAFAVYAFLEKTASQIRLGRAARGV